MSNISFDNVYLLFLIIPLVIVIAVPFALAIRKDNINGHNIASSVLHVIIALLVCFALAGTTINTVITETEVYVVADVSYSANRNLDTVDGYIQNVRSALPANSRMGVVAFGRDYELITELGGDIASVSTADVDESATDIAGALTYTAGLFHDGVIKRIVLITDGKESDPNGFGELSGTINSLYDSGIYVDAIYLDDNLPQGENEVQISSVDYSSTTYLGKDAVADVVVQSGSESRAILTLEVAQDGTSTYREWGEPQAVTLAPGSNVYNFSLCTTMAGTLNYRLTVDVEGEQTAHNNVYEFTQQVVENYKVLVITNRRVEYENIAAMYGDNAEVESYIVAGSQMSPPSIVEELCQYDEIVLANLDITGISNPKSFVDALNTVVSAYGKSLVTYGDLNIQNNDDATISQLQDMLPVRFGNASQAPRLITFVLDNSRSMAQNGQLQRAKDAITVMIDNFLNPEDYVAIVTFWGDTQLLVTARELSTNRNAIIEALNSVGYMQGTDIGAGLNRAYSHIADSEFSDKQVFLFSDGLSYHNADLDPEELVQQMYSDGIYTSSVFMGSTATNDDGGYADQAGYDAMSRLAYWGRGGAAEDSNFYIVNSDERFDDVVFGEIGDNTTDSVINDPSQVHIAVVGDDLVADIDSIPQVGGYYYTTAKASATTVLTVDYTRNDGEVLEVPLYTYWNYGSGRVATFSASFYEGWLEGWTTENNGGAIVGGIGRTNIPEEKVDYPYVLSVEYADGYCGIEVTPSALVPSASATVQVTMPDGTTVESYPKKFTSELYSYGFIPSTAGRYGITVTYSVGDNDYVASTYMTVSYLSEYNAFASYSAATLNRLINGRGVVSEDGSITIENNENELSTYTLSLTVPLFIAAVVLFVVDIIIRKLKWNDIKSLFVKIK